MEEFRDLSKEEWNFRNLVRENIGKPLEQQRIYWQQKRRIKWATLRMKIKVFPLQCNNKP
jgi:hypothetical protein